MTNFCLGDEYLLPTKFFTDKVLGKVKTYSQLKVTSLYELGFWNRKNIFEFSNSLETSNFKIVLIIVSFSTRYIKVNTCI